MIAPLTGMPLAGVFWYQGCANVGRAAQYEVCFKNMIEGWRKSFDNSSLPFYFVQLAGFQQPVAVQPDSEWALLRHAQSKALQLPNAGMATAISVTRWIFILQISRKWRDGCRCLPLTRHMVELKHVRLPAVLILKSAKGI